MVTGIGFVLAAGLAIVSHRLNIRTQYTRDRSSLATTWVRVSW